MSAPERRRKAWRVRHRDDELWTAAIVYAPTASQAKASRLYDAMECGVTAGSYFRDARVHRAPEYDILLPPPHRLLAELTPDEVDTLTHAYGGTGSRAGWRDHYVTDAGDLQLLRLCWVLGLFFGPAPWRVNGAALDGTPDTAVYRLTELGIAVAHSAQPLYPTY